MIFLAKDMNLKYLLFMSKSKTFQRNGLKISIKK